MKEIMHVKQLLQEQVTEMDQLLIQAEKSLYNAPDGTLILSRSNGTTQYYHKTDNKQKKGLYIAAKDRNKARALAWLNIPYQ